MKEEDIDLLGLDMINQDSIGIAGQGTNKKQTQTIQHRFSR